MEQPLKRRFPRSEGSSKKEIVKLLEIEKAYVRSAGVQEEEDVVKDVSLDYIHSFQIKTALLEVERKKAKAIVGMERQRMRIF